MAGGLVAAVGVAAVLSAQGGEAPPPTESSFDLQALAGDLECPTVFAEQAIYDQSGEGGLGSVGAVGDLALGTLEHLGATTVEPTVAADGDSALLSLRDSEGHLVGLYTATGGTAGWLLTASVTCGEAYR